MLKQAVLWCLIGLFFSVPASAQKIFYSDPEKEDPRGVEYQIIGKVSGNIVVYKHSRDVHFFCMYDAEMKMINKVKLDNFPANVLRADFIQYPDFFYMIYQYQQDDVFYCKGIKMDGNGTKLLDPVLLDTTQIHYRSNSKIYTVINSEDKQKILLFKINNKNERLNFVSTVLIDKYLNVQHKSRLPVPMTDKQSFLTEFEVDNDGDLAFLKAAGTNQNESIVSVGLYIKPGQSDSAVYHNLNLRNLDLNDIRVKVDNYNKHFLIGSFYAKQKRGNIDGLFVIIWDKDTDKELNSAAMVFNEEFRQDAKGESTIKTAFNNYAFKNIIIRQDGGFIVTAESEYTSTNGNYMNRYGYPYGSSYYSPYSAFGYGSPYSMYSPFNRYGNNYVNTNRYYADDIAILSVSADSKLEWTNVVKKSQYDDLNDQMLGYAMVNTGDLIHFLFTSQERKQPMFSDHSITADGQLNQSPTFHNLDKGYQFIPRQSKQVGSHVCIIPCLVRNNICFARVELP